MSAVFALRKAMRNALLADSALQALPTSGRIYDDVPQTAKPPYILLENTDSKDISGNDAPLTEHLLNVVVWSEEAGLAQAIRIASRISAILDGVNLTLDGYHLVNLQWRNTTAKRVNQKLRSVVVSFRAVTEPL